MSNSGNSNTSTPFRFAPTVEQNEWFEYFNTAFIGGVIDVLSTTMAVTMPRPGDPVVVSVSSEVYIVVNIRTI